MAGGKGFAALEEVERAVIEPGGTLTFIAKKPTPDEVRHREVLARLDQVTREIAGLRAGSSR